MPKKKLNVLIIEDEELLLKVIEKKLSSEGIKFSSVKTGKEALDHLLTEKALPDLIWLDYYLPDMNGLELMKKLREKNKFDDIPVLVISNSANDETVSKMMELGIREYIIKAEYRLEEIVKKISEVLNK
jgi:CitB family two-component system response regulator CitT